MDRVNIKYMAGRKQSANMLGLLFALMVTMPLSAPAASFQASAFSSAEKSQRHQSPFTPLSMRSPIMPCFTAI